MHALLRRHTSPHQSLCLLLAALIAATPATAVLAQPATAKPRNQVEPDSRPNPAIEKVRELDEKALIADPAKPAPKFNLRHAVPGAAVVVAVRPKQLLASAAVEMFPTEIVQAAAVQEMGLDPLTCEQLMVSVAPPMQGPPAYSVYATFAQPINLAEGKAFVDMERADIEGKPYFRSTRPDPMEPSFLALDARSLLAAPDFAMANLVEAPAAASPLAAQLAAADRGDDLLALVDAATLRPLIFMALAQSDLPPEAQPLLQIPNLIKTVSIRVNLSRPGDSELLAVANDEAAAQQLVGMFDEFKSQMAAKIRQETQKGMASEDPIEQAAARYSERMIKLFDERVQLVREGDSVVLARGNVAGEGGTPAMGVATAGILVALLLPAVQAAREAARRNVSMNNIHQLMLSMINYESAHGRFPAHAIYSDDGKPLLSWRVQMLPYLEEQELYEQFHLDEPWDSEHNKQLISQMPEVFYDPSSAGLTTLDGKTHYLGVQGDGYLFNGDQQGRKLKDITDGMSNSIAIVQVDDERAAIWTKPDDWQPDAEDPMKGLGGLHPAGALAGFCDGHVQFISEMIDADILLALLTVSGDEVINAPGF